MSRMILMMSPLFGAMAACMASGGDAADAPYDHFSLHTSTSLSQGEDKLGDFVMADIDRDGQPDLVYIKRRDTASGRIEVHVLSAASGYQQFLQRSASALSEAEGSSGDFTMADVDRDGRPDLVYIERRDTASGRIEVHVLSAASGYQQFLQHSASALSEAEGSLGDFTMADVDRDGRPDLVYIERRDTASGRIEVHVLSAASGYQQFLQRSASALSEAEGSPGDFTMADVDRDGRPDLVYIKRRDTGSGRIEVHVLSAASGYQQLIQHAASALPEAEDSLGDFTLTDVNRDGTPDLVYIKRRDTGTGTIELQFLPG